MSWKWALFLVVYLAAGFFPAGEASAGDQVPLMSKEELKSILALPDLVLIDVRQQGDWSGSDGKITGAIREDPRDFPAWQAKYQKGKTLVLYCA